MRKTGEHKCLFVRQAACDCDHPWGCNIITFPLYTCYCCYSSIQMPRTQAQRCTAPPCYQLWINILNEGKTTPEGDKKHLCCHSPRLRLRAQDSSDQLQEYNRWGLSQHRCTGNIFYSQGNIISPLAQQTQLLVQKILVCFCFVSLSTFVGHVHSFTREWHVCRAPGQVPMLSRNSPSLKIYLQPTAGAGVCQVQKFVRAGAGSICGPQLLGYRSLQRARDTWSGPGDQSISHMAHTKHRARLELNVKSFNITSQSSITGTIWWFKDVSAPARHKFSGFDGNQLVMAGVQTKY